jgi:hypothetical protein
MYSESEYSEDDLRLLQSINRSEVYTKNPPTRVKIPTIFKHPLPVSNHRYDYEKMLRRVLTYPIDIQVRSSVTLGNAWVLEEVLMSGAPINNVDTNGFSALHIAAKQNYFECALVLINCGANINAATVSGVTPLYMAVASRSSEVEKLLREQNALMQIETNLDLPGATVLELDLPVHNSIIHLKGKCVGMPHEHTMY